MAEDHKLPSFEKKKEKSSFSSMALKSLSVLFLVFFIMFSLYWLFGRVAFENLDRSELFSNVIQGHADSRRSTSLEWVSILQKAEASSDFETLREFLPTPVQTQALIRELEAIQISARPDAETIAGMLGVLGFSYSVEASEALKDFVRAQHTNPSMGRANVFAILGLGRRNPDSLGVLDLYGELLDKQISDEDLKKTIAYVIGFRGEGEMSTEEWELKRGLLERLLEVRSPVVRLNAAMSAQRLGFEMEKAERELKRLLAELVSDAQQDSNLSEERKRDLYQRQDAYFGVLSIFSGEISPSLRETINVIANSHPDLKIRQAAIEALKGAD